jgi:hypothetical protein
VVSSKLKKGSCLPGLGEQESRSVPLIVILVCLVVFAHEGYDAASAIAMVSSATMLAIHFLRSRRRPASPRRSSRVRSA